VRVSFSKTTTSALLAERLKAGQQRREARLRLFHLVADGINGVLGRYGSRFDALVLGVGLVESALAILARAVFAAPYAIVQRLFFHFPEYSTQA
jgi:uncharacterized membrane protein